MRHGREHWSSKAVDATFQIADILRGIMDGRELLALQAANRVNS